MPVLGGGERAKDLRNRSPEGTSTWEWGWLSFVGEFMSRAGTGVQKGDTVEGYKVLAELGCARGIDHLPVQGNPRPSYHGALKHVEKIEPKRPAVP